MSSTRAQIEILHSEYVELTGHTIFLNPGRERDWFEWLRYRQPAFTHGDLCLVIAHIKRGIRDTRRQPAALKFSNLIGMPDRFEEDLAEARALSRPKPAAEKTVKTGATERRVPSDGTEDTARSAGDVLKNIQQLKDAAQ